MRLRGDHISALLPYKFHGRIPSWINCYFYSLSKGNGSDTHPLVIETESKVLRAEAVAQSADRMRESGYVPDVIIAHPGWGESLFLGDIWPDTPQIHYVVFSYRKKGTDTDFLDKFNVKPDLFDNTRGRMKNANVLLNLDQMAAGITPTAFQHSTLPHWAQSKTHVIHDGIDTNWARPRQGISLRVGDHTFNSDSELVTFVNRTYEPYRGIHIFIDSLQKVLRDCPNTYVLLVGQDTPNVSYGKKREDGQGWLSILRREYSDSIDWSRVLDLGRISMSTFS